MYFFTNDAFVGGIAGWNNGVIRDCRVSSIYIDGYGHKGGIVGYNYTAGKIIQCAFDGAITNRYVNSEQDYQYSVGGIVGINYYGEITLCHTYGKINFYLNGSECDSRKMQPRMGKLIGTNYGKYNDCASNNYVDTNGLKEVKWKEKWFWTKTFDQRLYCGNDCGEDCKK